MVHLVPDGKGVRGAPRLPWEHLWPLTVLRTKYGILVSILRCYFIFLNFSSFLVFCIDEIRYLLGL